MSILNSQEWYEHLMKTAFSKGPGKDVSTWIITKAHISSSIITALYTSPFNKHIWVLHFCSVYPHIQEDTESWKMWVFSGLRSLSLQSRIWKMQHAVKFAFTETSTAEPGLGIQRIKLYLPPSTFSFLSKQQAYDLFSQGNKWEAESFFPDYSLPAIPPPSVHCLPGSLCLSTLCYLATLFITERSESSPHPKATLKNKTNAGKRLCLFWWMRTASPNS